MRWHIGLVDPPLVMTDPLMHYRFAPSQTCYRLHHVIHYNAYSMRSDDFPPHKTDPAELRIVMIGDSVINGGSMTDQSEVVSTLLQTSLSNDLHRPVVVGNASAGGWGPPSELGWVQTFGVLDADIVVLVVSSHDYGDVPTWPLEMGLEFDRPERKPLLAWQEFFARFASRFVPNFLWTPSEPVVDTSRSETRDIDWCSWAIQRIIQIAHGQGALVIVAQHAETSELGGKWKPGHAFNEASAEAAGADRIVQFEPVFRMAREAGHDPYRPNDFIHPNKTGHKLMAEDLRQSIETLLAEPSGPTSRPAGR